MANPNCAVCGGRGEVWVRQYDENGVEIGGYWAPCPAPGCG